MKRPQFSNNQIYHIYNRGVEKRIIFTETKNYLRFISDLQEFNSRGPVLNLGRALERHRNEVGLQSGRNLVEVLAFCLIPNHFHLMLRQKTEKGITEFMRKLGTGYTNYFNLKYRRVGPLFQGKFKAILLNKENHILYLPHYIHLNPLDRIILKENIKNTDTVSKIIGQLKIYKWSSLPDYLGIRNFPGLVNKNFIIGCSGGLKKFIKNMEEWIKHPNLDNITTVSLDLESD